MKNFIKKINLAAALVLTLSIGHAYGDNGNSNAYRGGEYGNAYAYGDNACCCPCQPQCGKVFFSASLLYWRAHQKGLDTCYPCYESNTVAPDGRITSVFKGRGRDIDFDWKPGFRIGAGYQLPCSNWGMGATWTHFNSKATGHRGNENHLRWNIDLDVVDLFTAYQYDWSPCFSLSPFLGIRGARINQNLHVGGFPNSATFATAQEGSLFAQHDKERFLGLGPLFGLEGDLKIGCGFSLYARGSISWLYGRSHVTFLETQATIDTLDFCETKNTHNSILTVGDAGFGVRWHTCFCDDKKFYLQLGFEHHRYLDFNHLGECDDLSFDGVELGVGVEF